MEISPLDKMPPRSLPCSTAPLPTKSSSVITEKSNHALKSTLPVENIQRERLDSPPSSLLQALSAPFLEDVSQQQCKNNFEERLVQKNEHLELIGQVCIQNKGAPTPMPQSAENERALKRSIDARNCDLSASRMLKRTRRDKSMECNTSASQGRQQSADTVKEYPRSKSISPNVLADTGRLHKTSSHSYSRSIDARKDILNSLKMPLRATRPRATLLVSRRNSLSPAPEADNSTVQRSRTEILALRVLSVEDFLSAMKEPKQIRRSSAKLSKIPVPLFPGETLDDYEQHFGRWLHKRLTSVLSLRFSPLKERVYRHQFALYRVNKRPTITNFKCPHQQRLSLSPIPKESDGFCRTHATPQSSGECMTLAMDIRSTSLQRKDILQIKAEEPTTRVSLDASFRTTSFPNDRTVRTCKPSDIHTPDTIKNEPNTSLQTGKQVAQNFCFAQENESSRDKQKAGEEPRVCTNIAFKDLSAQALTRSDQALGTVKTTALTNDKLPRWAVILISNVEKLEAKVKLLQYQVDSCRCQQDDTSQDNHFKADLARNHNSSLHSQDVASTCKNSSCNGDLSFESSRKCMNHESKKSVLDKSEHTLSAHLFTAKYDERDEGRIGRTTEKLPNCDYIYLDATLALARADQAQESKHPKKPQLMKAYDKLNKQISVNETAIDDALVYIKTIEDADEAAVMEHHSQIMELVVSINKEKEKRGEALANLIICSFIDHQSALLQLLEKESSRKETSGANHDLLRIIFSQIKQKDNDLEKLKQQLNEQIQCATGLLSDGLSTEKALRFKALKELSKRLMKERAAKEHLEDERDNVLKRFLKDDEEIRKLVKERLTISEAEGT